MKCCLRVDVCERQSVCGGGQRVREFLAKVAIRDGDGDGDGADCWLVSWRIVIVIRSLAFLFRCFFDLDIDFWHSNIHNMVFALGS
jgi:hypothetical protein